MRPQATFNEPGTKPRQRAWRCGLGVAGLWLIAALLRGWGAPAFERMPDDFVADIAYLGEAESRQTPEAPAETFQSIIRRRDQVLSADSKHVIVQGDLHWLTPKGAVIFETLNLYGVDRRTRGNLKGYGNLDRQGQYFFPPHTAKQDYILWDPNYAGPALVRFSKIENFRGMEVYVFHSSVEALDETAGFTALPDVPQRYHALTYGKGSFWVEPVSGITVDHEDGGSSYFIDVHTGLRVGQPIIHWRQRYTPETIIAQMRLAQAQRFWMFALETGLPWFFFAAGLMWLGLFCYRKKRA